MNDGTNPNLHEVGAYGMVEITTYLRLKRKTVEYWTFSGDSPLVALPQAQPPRFSFMNLLECHVLNAMRVKGIPLPRIRLAVETAQRDSPKKHPLIQNHFLTDGQTLFFDYVASLLDIGRGGQGVFRDFVYGFLERIDIQGERIQFYPFLDPHDKKPTEPRIIQMDPGVSFGRPVIAGTGISTAILASRFGARESVDELAKEYGRPREEIEEAIRWEGRLAA